MFSRNGEFLMQGQSVWISIIVSFGSTAFLLLVPLVVPAIRAALAKYVTGLVQHHFDDRLERLKSDLRQTEETVRSGLRANESRINSLTETALSLRSARQAALDARKLQAIEKLWAAKIGIDRWKLAAQIVSILNLEEAFKAAKAGDKGLEEFARAMDKSVGIQLDKQTEFPSAMSERPFLPAEVWAVYSAYVGVIIYSVMALKVLATGGARFWKNEDNQKSTMLAVLPEYQAYIEQYGVSGYYHLLDVLEQKLLNAISELLDGKDYDVAAVQRYTAIASMVGDSISDLDRAIPNELRSPEPPPPSPKA
jgi:hypothetical protein